MRYIRLFSAALLLGVLFFGCKKDTGSDNKSLVIEDLLVKNNDVSGWAYLGSSWVASSQPELTQQIDGGSELYFKYGFVEASCQKYSGNIIDISNEIMLIVYNLSSEQNAVGLFDDPDLGLSSAITWSDGAAGTRAKYNRNGGLSQELKFYRDKYLVELSITDDSDESLYILKLFALNIDEKIKGGLN